MKTEYTQPPVEVLNLIGTDPRTTKEFAYAHTVCDSYVNFKHYCALIYPARYEVTPEQKESAQKLYEGMKKQAVEQIGNKLMFVGMGMQYDARYEGDLCNHRIRTEIVNPEGRRFFIEVGTGRGDTMHFDFVIDRDQEKEYEEKRSYYYNKIKEDGGFFKHGKGSHLYDQHEKYQSQPYYWYKKDQWQSLNVQYNKKNLLKVVNDLFDCKFSEVEVDYYFLRCEDYVSTSPK